MERAGLSEPELTAAARALGALLQPGDVVLLRGPMGAGKTTLTRALAEGLGVDRPDRVRSPTFNLCLVHHGPRSLVHVDLFRLADDEGPVAGSVGAAAFEALGLAAMIEGEPLEFGATPVVLVVEWADLWADPPASALWIEIGLDSTNLAHRTLIVRPTGERPRALVAAWERAIGRADPPSLAHGRRP
ncbi:tRNA (adenosine(37)-N6)-threonylcarbamoyltransferase complex ATPase subunit type 1 TsaE [Paraliomyxa miuraensis]|uniref:tRNA (adenosine(37)-N6)-threonylcarbamoyltransferase complex ATPase subunit type 1 TsaE n=1 Tax=Paraliomyxa miuraensis TaxID=376150 RepID=UPI002250B3EF|nr:tRNA (adenosine(37)-N6)-threonylcarbamoyltransferase complex ATPase subunit type 1 TsaE [Paraliomyxa miuraensis]MCX4240070.1 tRNA (adenosine(37)-N6)-threonylcarbamoyltransferase complex ATPase subunit type 1 TsaE [Paraliomyxa miuraensis]